MVASRSLWLLIPRPIRQLPADLAVVTAFVVATNVAVFAPLIRETPLRVALGLVFVLFAPGYAFIAALFPEDGETPEPAGSDADGGDTTDSDGWSDSLSSREGIDGIERVALSFGLSIAIVPLIGLVLNFTPWGIRLTPIAVAVSGFTLASTAVAATRRWELPADERFRVPYRDWYAAGRAELFEPDTRADAALNILLVLSVLLAAGSVGYAVLVPPDGEQFSAIYLLTEDDDGELVADDYPTEFVQGESQELIVGIDNHEHETTDYTVVVLEQDVEVIGNETVDGNATANETVDGNATANETVDGNATANETVDGNATANETVDGNATANETVVREQRELDRFSTTIAHNESWHREYDLEPTMVGENQRVVWLLFPGGDVPAEPSMDDTEYSVHLWVDVAEATNSSAPDGV